MSHLPPPPPPPPATTPAAAPEGKKGPGKGKTAAIVAAALLLFAAAGAAAVIFIPSLAALAGIPGADSPSPAAAGPSAMSTVPPSSAAPTASPSATSAPTFEMAPAITSAAPSAAAPSAVPSAGTLGSSVDLGLAIPVDIVPCNGKYLTFYYSAIVPATYATDIQSALNSYPGSRYLTTEGSCSALNQISKDGTRIYGVYSGPYDTAAAACQARAGVSGSYVKVMNPSTNSESTVACG